MNYADGDLHWKHCSDVYDGRCVRSNVRGGEKLDQQEETKIRFIRFLFTDGEGVRKIYDADWPDQFIAYFADKKVTEIGGFFMMGVLLSVKTLDDAIKICKG